MKQIKVKLIHTLHQHGLIFHEIKLQAMIDSLSNNSGVDQISGVMDFLTSNDKQLFLTTNNCEHIDKLIAELKSQKAEIEDKLNVAHKTLRHLNAQLKDKEERLERQEYMAKKNIAEICELKGKLDKCFEAGMAEDSHRRSNDILREATNSLSKTVKTVTEENEKLRREIEGLDCQAIKAYANNIKVGLGFMNEIEALKEENERLKKYYFNIKEDNDTLKNEINKLLCIPVFSRLNHMVDVKIKI